VISVPIHLAASCPLHGRDRREANMHLCAGFSVAGSLRYGMPAPDQAELNAIILSGRIGAISIDTSIFDRYQCGLDYPSLIKLAQFRDTHISVLISEIVAEEVKAHINRDASKSQRDLRNAMTAHTRRWSLGTDPQLPGDPYRLSQTSADFAQQQFTDYLDTVAAEIVPAARSTNVARKVVQRYFEVTAPFETSDKKKAEFPDAFALLSLEEWAEDAGKLVLCVSTDAGWKRFAESSPHLICVDQLDPVFDLFNEAGRGFAKRVLTMLQSGEADRAMTVIFEAFEYRLDDNEFDVSVADSPADYEFEQVSAVLQKLDWHDVLPNVLAEDKETVTFSFRVRALIEFTVNFVFYVRDGIDHDDVRIGSEELSTERWLNFDLALTVSRDTGDDVEIIEAMASRRGMTAVFGRIDPFRYDDPTHEKY